MTASAFRSLHPPLPTLDFVAHGSETLSLKLFFTPDSAILASVNETEACRLWEPHSGKLLREFGTRVEDAAFSADGRLLLALDDGEVKIWEVGTGYLSHQWRLPEHRCATICGFGGDGKICGVGGGGYTLGLGWYAAWDVDSSIQLCRGELAGGDQDEIGVVAIGDTADGRFAAWSKEQCNLPGAVFVHDLRTGQLIAEGKFERITRVFPPTCIAATLFEEEIRLCDLRSRQSWAIPSRAQRLPLSSASGSLIVWIEETGERGGKPACCESLALYSVPQRRLLHTLPLEPGCASLQFSSFHDDVLATITNLVKWKGSPEHTVFWDAPSGEPLGWAKRHQMYARYAFSPDGRWFASGTSVHSSACDGDRVAPGTVLLTDLGDTFVRERRV